jgi:hypothetical protein
MGDGGPMPWIAMLAALDERPPAILTAVWLFQEVVPLPLLHSTISFY